MALTHCARATYVAGCLPELSAEQLCHLVALASRDLVAVLLARPTRTRRVDIHRSTDRLDDAGRSELLERQVQGMKRSASALLLDLALQHAVDRAIESTQYGPHTTGHLDTTN